MKTYDILITDDKHTAVLEYVASSPPQPVVCAGCGRPPNHTKAHAIGKEIIHCPRCDREVIRLLRSESAIREWNKVNE